MKRPVRWTGRRAAKLTEYRGVLYHSKAEARYAAVLDSEMRAKRVVKWERQVRVPLVINGQHWRTMVVDFRVHYPGGLTALHEVKGYPEVTWRMKREVYDILHATGEMPEPYVVLSATTLQPAAWAKKRKGRKKK